ncbi:MAG: transposase [Elusimicrobia bacterium]|nr:transposase [Elusimicrobiota bacterium]
MNLSENYRKNSLRLKTWDYFLPGSYFFTICTFKRAVIFNAEFIRNKTIDIFKNLSTIKDVTIHVIVITIDHIHGLVTLPEERKVNLSQYIGISKVKITQMVRKECDQTMGGQARPYADMIGFHYKKKQADMIWQRSYYDHIIRNEQDFNEKAKYIENHPFKEDSEIYSEWH